MFEKALEGLEIKLLSVDIFDTLLFRTVRTPTEVFEVMFRENPSIFPDYIDHVEWKNIRIRAEKEARIKKEKEIGAPEVILSDIYAELPLHFPNKDKIQVFEIETEKKCCFLNSQIYDSLFRFYKEKKAKIILTSDMYLTKTQVIDLLETTGFDIRIIDEIFMSCEYKISKRRGGLYDIILEKYNLKPEEILHVGDNISSDINSAIKKGIKTFHYDLISGSFSRYPFLELEQLKFGNCINELFSLRTLAANRGSNLSEEEKKWHEMGSMILGPFFTYATEWVLDVAEKNNINTIYPLMREGYFLSRMLSEAISSRNMKCEIKPLYVSRKSLYLASLIREKIGNKEIEYILNTFNFKIRDLFELLSLEVPLQFIDYTDMESIYSRKIFDNDESIYEKVKKYLLQSEVLEKIKTKAKDNRDLSLKYLRQSGLCSRSITLDIGWRGTIQHCIEKILRSDANVTGHLHLLFFGRDATIECHFDNIDIRGFVGSFGKNRGLISQLFVRCMELFAMCEHGTTVGYSDVDDWVRPIICDIHYPSREQMNQIKRVQQGILDFQKEFYFKRDLCGNIKKLAFKEDELIKPIVRLFSNPLYKEAKNLGDWYYDQNFGANKMSKIIDDLKIKELNRVGIDQFLSSDSPRSAEWYPGMVALRSPFALMKQKCVEVGSIEKLRRILFVEAIIKETSECKSIVIVGAGQAGRDILKYLRIGNENLSIEAFVDNNESLHGLTIEGIKIKSINEEFDSPCYVIGSFAFKDELILQVKEKKGNSVKILYFDDSGKL